MTNLRNINDYRPIWRYVFQTCPCGAQAFAALELGLPETALYCASCEQDSAEVRATWTAEPMTIQEIRAEHALTLDEFGTPNAFFNLMIQKT